MGLSLGGLVKQPSQAVLGLITKLAKILQAIA
jgi:hypothetical protein